MKAFLGVFRTELRLATRSFDMLVFGIAFPVGVMLLLGCISSPEAVRLDFGGVVAIGICAAGLMGLPLALSDYRHRKVLKRMRVTPASPALLLGAQTVTQFLFSFVSSGLVLAIARLAFGVRIAAPFGRFLLAYLFVQLAIFGIGFLVASLSPSIKVAGAVASLLYFPMLFLSGTTVPYEIMPRGLQRVSDVFPLTQGVKLLKAAVMGEPLGGYLVPAIALGAVALASYALSLRLFRWE